MNKEIFVQNVKHFCTLKGVKPTPACRDSGVGTSFLTDVNKGKIPSVAKVQMLATYLGVSTSELLGETVGSETQSGPASKSAEEAALDVELISRLCRLTPEELAHVDAFVQGLLASR